MFGRVMPKELYPESGELCQGSYARGVLSRVLGSYVLGSNARRVMPGDLSSYARGSEELCLVELCPRELYPGGDLLGEVMSGGVMSGSYVQEVMSGGLGRRSYARGCSVQGIFIINSSSESSVWLASVSLIRWLQPGGLVDFNQSSTAGPIDVRWTRLASARDGLAM